MMDRFVDFYDKARRFPVLPLTLILLLIVLGIQAVYALLDRHYMTVTTVNAETLRIMGGAGLKPADAVIDSKVDELRSQDLLPPPANVQPLIPIQVLEGEIRARDDSTPSPSAQEPSSSRSGPVGEAAVHHPEAKDHDGPDADDQQ